MQRYPLDEVIEAAGGRLAEVGGPSGVVDFGDPQAEYNSALTAAGLYDARDRGFIEITGGDRAAWLHNLLTNSVKTLQPGEGNYAFATNAKGRIVFDANVVVLADRIRLDVARPFVAKAAAHLERYHITEDVQLVDRSIEFCRISLVGPRSSEIAEALGGSHGANMAALNSAFIPLAGQPRLMVRNDSAGATGLELYLEAEPAAECWAELVEVGRPVLQPVGRSAIDVLRIEAGIPVYGEDIDEEVLPAETGQLERAVSYQKGCYLGQEVVERMRSRGSPARMLVGLKLSGSGGVHPGAELRIGETAVGRLTSVCESYAVGSTIGLGYVRTAHAKPGTLLELAAPSPVQAVVHTLPFRA